MMMSISKLLTRSRMVVCMCVVVLQAKLYKTFAVCNCIIRR